MKYAGDFLKNNDKITEDDLKNVEASIDSSYIENIKLWAAKE